MKDDNRKVKEKMIDKNGGEKLLSLPQNDGIDVMKFILSFFVCAIHTVGYGIYPIARIAVPFFFIVSGYLFFAKQLITKRIRIREHISLLL